MRALLLAVALLPPQALPLLLPPPAITGHSDMVSPLLGVWDGFRTVRPSRGCRPEHGHVSREPVTLRRKAALDGSLVATLVVAEAPGDRPETWRGQVEGDRLGFVAPRTMTCRGKEHRYVVRPSGRVPVRGNGRRTTLRLAAEDGSCGCGLDVRYQLTWTAP